MRLIPLLLLLPAVAPAQSAAPRRTLQFSGHEWIVKSSTRPVGPGPNWFSGDPEDVGVDARDRLHMRIRNRDGHWWSTELGTKANLGHGEYRFHLDSNIDALDPNIVLGLFTWDNDPTEAHREIDIEVSRWGRENDDNIQFVLQPYQVPGNRLRFMLPAGIDRSIHSFTWREDRITFSIVSAGSETPIRQFSVTENIPRAGRENARINFWLNRGAAPANGQDAEVVFSKFEFVPWR